MVHLGQQSYHPGSQHHPETVWKSKSNAWGLRRWYSGKELACQGRNRRRCRFYPWVRKFPWSRKWQPIPVFFPGKFHGQGVWWATVHGLEKGWTRMSTQRTHTNTLGQIELARNLGIIWAEWLKKATRGEDIRGQVQTLAKACIQMLEEKEKLATKGRGQRSGDETKMAQGHETQERRKLRGSGSRCAKGEEI